MEDYPNEPDDGHEHDYVYADDLPDTGTDAETMICTLCGQITCDDGEEA